MQAEIDKATQSVLAAWKTRHEAQQKIMVWPEEIEQSFIDQFAQFDPPETFPKENNGLGLLSYLKIYNRQIPDTMDRICKIIDTKWEHANEVRESAGVDENDQRSGRGGGGREGEGRGDRGDRGDRATPKIDVKGDDPNSIVVRWDEDNQQLWNDKLTLFANRDDNTLPGKVPSPSQVYMLQQDLWLLEAMFKIIKNVNGAADANDLAVIKKIDHVAFGREAITQLGEITEPSMIEAAAAKNSGGLKSSSDLQKERISNRRQALANAAGGNGTGLNYAGQPAYHGRYVDTSFNPLKAEDVVAVITGTELPEVNLELIVSKRVPVRFAVEMDERKIPDFLVECARSDFTFEVNQVRINRHKPGEGIQLAGGNSGGGGGEGREERDTPTAAVGGGSGGSVGLDGGDSDANTNEGTIGPVEKRTNYIVKVEFYGIVKIYNPVNEELLTGKKKTPAPAAGDQAEDAATKP